MKCGRCGATVKGYASINGVRYCHDDGADCYVEQCHADSAASMLAHAARGHGMTLAELKAQGDAGTLADPELRDLWLIWGGLA